MATNIKQTLKKPTVRYCRWPQGNAMAGQCGLDSSNKNNKRITQQLTTGRRHSKDVHLFCGCCVSLFIYYLICTIIFWFIKAINIHFTSLWHVLKDFFTMDVVSYYKIAVQWRRVAAVIAVRKKVSMFNFNYFLCYYF